MKLISLDAALAALAPEKHRAHTYASENADLYRSYDNGVAAAKAVIERISAIDLDGLVGAVRLVMAQVRTVQTELDESVHDGIRVGDIDAMKVAMGTLAAELAKVEGLLK